MSSVTCQVSRVSRVTAHLEGELLGAGPVRGAAARAVVTRLALAHGTPLGVAAVHAAWAGHSTVQYSTVQYSTVQTAQR